MVDLSEFCKALTGMSYDQYVANKIKKCVHTASK